MHGAERAVSVAMGRDYSDLLADVAEVLELGLPERDGTALRCEIGQDRAEPAAA